MEPSEPAAEPSKPSRWHHVPTTIMWITTVGASLAAVIAALAEIGVFSSGDDKAAAAASKVPVVVQIELADGGQLRGFFTAHGRVVSTALARGGHASWSDGAERARAELVVAAEQGDLALFTVAGHAAPTADFAVRTAASLRPGDPVVLYLGPQQRTSGRISDDAGTGPYPLVTSRISAMGDLGAPLLDGEDRLIGVVAGHDANHTYARPIESIRAAFPDEF